MNRISILGARESGIGAAILAKTNGFDVWVSDFGKIPEKYRKELQENQLHFEEGKHSEKEILNSILVVKSPGIPENAPIVKKIRAAGVKIISEIEFASKYTDAKIIGVTGTNGKTTTTSLIHHVMERAGLNVGCGGNIGESFARLVATKDHDHYVLEISSFQLDDIEEFRPDIAVLLNITPDHLDRYQYDFNKYVDSKFRIAINQKEDDAFIYCLDDPLTMDAMQNANVKAKRFGFSLEHKENSTAWTENKIIQVQMELDKSSYRLDQMDLVGKHNIYNTMAAAIVSRILELRKETVRDAFADFRNLEHRLEKVAFVRGVEFINDSKATNVNSCWYALECVDKPIVWIAGGMDKGNDYSLLIPLVEKKVKTIIALGKDVRKIQQAFGKHVNLIMHSEDMDEAVKIAHHLSDKGDVVLLSPACASFDLFEDYQDRGRKFKKAVKEL